MKTAGESARECPDLCEHKEWCIQGTLHESMIVYSLLPHVQAKKGNK
jgi:hypothetical protein